MCNKSLGCHNIFIETVENAMPSKQWQHSDDSLWFNTTQNSYICLFNPLFYNEIIHIYTDIIVTSQHERNVLHVRYFPSFNAYRLMRL